MIALFAHIIHVLLYYTVNDTESALVKVDSNWLTTNRAKYNVLMQHHIPYPTENIKNNNELVIRSYTRYNSVIIVSLYSLRLVYFYNILLLYLHTLYKVYILLYCTLGHHTSLVFEKVIYDISHHCITV